MRLILEALIALATLVHACAATVLAEDPSVAADFGITAFADAGFSSRRKAAECLKSSCAKNPAVFQSASIRSSDKTGVRTRGGDRGGRRSTLPFRSMARADSGSADRCTRPISRHRALVVPEPFPSDSPGTGAIQQCTRRIASLSLVAAHRRRCPDLLANAVDLLCPSGAANRRRNRHSRQSRVGEPRTQVRDGTGQTRR